MDAILELISQSDIDVASMINLKIVIILLGIGFCIKHIPYLEKLSNEFIPIILMVFSLVLTFLNLGLSIDSFANGILTASVAIGIHQQGKGFLKSISTILGNAAEDDVEEEEE